MVQLLALLKEIIANPTDEQPDEKPNEEADEQPGEKTDEQPDTTNIPHCKSEESAAQRRNQQGQGPRTLTPDQMLKRSPMSLA